jgi:adenylate cyclase
MKILATLHILGNRVTNGMLRLVRSRALRLHLLALLVAACAVPPAVFSWGEEMESQWGLKLLSRLRNRIDGDLGPKDVVILNIDRQAFFDARYPALTQCVQHSKGQPLQRCWPRTRYGEIIATLKQRGAALVILNVLFVDPKEREDWPLAAAIREAGNVLLQDYLSPNPTGVTSEFIAVSPPPSPLPEAAAATAPLPVRDSRGELIQLWTAIPSVRMTPEGNVAELRPTLPVMALHLMVLRQSLDQLTEALKPFAPAIADYLEEHRDDPGPNALAEGLASRLMMLFDRQPELAGEVLEHLDGLPVRDRSNAYLNALLRLYRSDHALYLNPYGPAGTVTTLTLQALEDDSDVFRGKVVVIAPSQELGRPVKGGTFPTVFSEIGSGELLATAYANLVEDRLLKPLPATAQAVLALAWGYLVTLAAARLPVAWGIAVLTALTAVFLTTALAAFRNEVIWTPVVSPSIQVIAALLVGFACRYQEQQRRIRELIAIKIPAALVPVLERAETPLAGDFIHCDGVCLVTDGEGYTALTDARDGKWLAHFMKDYQAVVERPVREHGGTVKDWAGDGMMALWWTRASDAAPGTRRPGNLMQRWLSRARGGPLQRRRVDRRTYALDAALHIQERVVRFTREREIRFPIRIGLNFGPMWIAYAGELKAFGDTLNTTQRLESLNKVLGTRILVSEPVIAGITGYTTRDLGIFVLPGKKQPLRVHELLGHTARVSAGLHTLAGGFANALERFEKGDWHGAFELFALLREDFPDDGPTHFYLKACRERLRAA